VSAGGAGDEVVPGFADEFFHLNPIWQIRQQRSTDVDGNYPESEPHSAQAPPLEGAPMLVLQMVCPESHCLRHSPAPPSVDRLSMRVSGQRR
jgi:hypothetical protein